MSQIIEGESREIAIREPHEALALPDHASARAQLAKVREFQMVVRELFVEGHDFGVIPNTGSKATLLKPGAEKLIKLLGLADTYDFLDRVEDWDREFFNYTVRCRLVSLQTGQIVAEGLGNCNSRESKYRWRWLWPNELTESEKVGLKTRSTRSGGKQYRVENDDIASSINTIIKMAKKRSQVDAALSVGRLSDVFTQDLEDMTTPDTSDASEPARHPAPAQPPAPRTPPAAPVVKNGETTDGQRSAIQSMFARIGRSVDIPERFEDAGRLIQQLNDEINQRKAQDAPSAERQAEPEAAPIPAEPQPKGEPTPERPSGDGSLVCAECGEALTETKFRDDTIWTPTQLAAYGHRKHGRALCMAHYREANDAARRAQSLGAVPF